MARKKNESDFEEEFLRDWGKLQSNLQDDTLFCRLPFEVQGIWWQLLLYSMRKSKQPGLFLDPTTERPWREDEIAYPLALNVERIQPIVDGMALLHKHAPHLLGYSRSEGWFIPNYSERFCTENERLKIRRANARRQRRKRARDRVKDAGVVRFPAAGAAQ